ncbi:MAG TPA: hypothetical protein VH415_08120 [Nitrososphaeraceae archaeon]|jgi:hypothetical protein
MTSIKIFENAKRQNLEKEVNKFLEAYKNYTTSVNLSTFINNQYPTYLALVTIQEKIPPVNVETSNNR